MTPRIYPVDRKDADPRVEEMYKRMDAMGNPPPNMHLTFGKNPALYESWLPFATYVIPSSSLSHRDRQILILRTAYNWKSGYVWSQHVLISKHFSALLEAEIANLCNDGEDSSWSENESALIAACDETRTDGVISDPTWLRLSSHYSEANLIDIVFAIGQYGLISTSLRSLKVQLDDGLVLPDWAE